MSAVIATTGGLNKRGISTTSNGRFKNMMDTSSQMLGVVGNKQQHGGDYGQDEFSKRPLTSHPTSGVSSYRPIIAKH